MKIRGTTITTPIARHAVTDDSAVDKKPWSSKNTVDKLCPSFTERGALVTCNPVEGYPLEVVTRLPDSEPGVTSLTLYHAGKNLWNFKSGLSQCRGVSASSGADVIRYGYIVTLPPGTYTVSGQVLSGSNYIYFNPIHLETLVMGALTYFITHSGATTAKVTLQENQGLFFYNANTAATEDESKKIFYENVNIQIEAGNTATAYEPYKGKVKTITFPEPFSSGIYNWVTGEFEAIGGGGGVIDETAQPICGFFGDNNIWSSNGETEVRGKTDPTAIIKKLTNAIIALGGNI